jgi:hypothetical protein
VGGNLVTYTDCPDALGTPGNQATYTLDMARKASLAYGIAAGGSGSSMPVSCDGGQDNAYALEELAGTTVTDVITWTFAGPNAGHVHDSGADAPICPTASDPTWN